MHSTWNGCLIANLPCCSAQVFYVRFSTCLFSKNWLTSQVNKLWILLRCFTDYMYRVIFLLFIWWWMKMPTEDNINVCFYQWRKLMRKLIISLFFRCIFLWCRDVPLPSSSSSLLYFPRPLYHSLTPSLPDLPLSTHVYPWPFFIGNSFCVLLRSSLVPLHTPRVPPPFLHHQPLPLGNSGPLASPCSPLHKEHILFLFIPISCSLLHHLSLSLFLFLYSLSCFLSV